MAETFEDFRFDVQRISVLSEVGNQLETREDSLVVVRKLEELVGEKTLLLLDFEGQKALNAGSIYTVLNGLHEAVQRTRDRYVAAAMTNVSESITESLEIYLGASRSKSGLRTDCIASLNPAEVNVISSNQIRPITFQAGQELTINQGHFTAPELAQHLDIAPDGATHRLNFLTTAGALIRAPDRSSPRGFRFKYRALVPEDFSA